MPINKTYTGRELVDRYDYHHFGGSGGQYILHRDWQILASLLEPPPGRILDIPCGTGIYTEKLNQVGYQVVSADVSNDMLQRAAQRVPAGPRLSCDIRQMPFPEASFDAAITVRLFQHYPQQELVPMLRELGRVTKTRGRVVFDTFRWTPRRMPLLRHIFRGEMYVFSHREVEEMIEAAGLVRVHKVSLYLFSPIWQRKLPAWFLRVLKALEGSLPPGWLLRTFWSCTKGSC